MCGIFGVSLPAQSGIPVSALESLCSRLLVQSESRGKEAAGIAIIHPNQLSVYRRPVCASVLLRALDYKNLFRSLGNSNNIIDMPVTVIGHARMVTNGLRTSNDNNQPVVKDGAAVIHNGIIVNVDELWEQFPQLKKRHDLDSEVIPSLIQMFRDQGMELIHATRSMYASIEGMASISALFNDLDCMLLATNNGSLYTAENAAGTAHLFASEKIILTQTLSNRSVESWLGSYQIEHVKPGCGRTIGLADLAIRPFSLEDNETYQSQTFPERPIQILANPDPECSSKEFDVTLNIPKTFLSQFESWDEKIQSLRRCTKCILPETMPFINFDEDGVCNYCRNYKKTEAKGHDSLEAEVAPHRRRNGSPDCIINISGGRDSCYGLHYICKHLGMTPLAYTYDWGMVTDLARRNTSRLCSKLGVEHILVSADIVQKREFIRKNLSAWVKKPDIGLIPLLMAGDKHYFYHSLKLKKAYELPLAITCRNSLEKTHFKTGFCGIEEGCGRGPYDLPLAKKLKIAWYYTSRFIRNPGYLNSSLTDTLTGFLSSYGMNHDFLFFYDYIPWDEENLINTLRKEYDWEVSKDTSGTWRIGDGTAAFYNYVYYTVAGFTEIDTFLSNQIREGTLDRETALPTAREENQPRFDSIRWYLAIVGLGDAFEEIIQSINAMPRCYAT